MSRFLCAMPYKNGNNSYIIKAMALITILLLHVLNATKIMMLIKQM